MKKVILIISAILVLLSWINIEYAFVQSKILRIIISNIFLFFALRVGHIGKNAGVIPFVLLPLCDVFLLGWEKDFIKLAYYVTHIILLLTLMFLTVRVLGRVKVTIFDIIVLGAFLGINSFILLYLGQFFSIDSQSDILEVTFYINGFLIIVLVLIAFFFSIHKANTLTSYFFLGVLLLSLSELVVYTILFMDQKNWQNIDNLLYVISLFFLVRSFQEHVIFIETESI